MGLLERESLLGELTRLITEAGAGHGRLALIGGEAGVGKTSLVHELARAAPRGVRRLWGACDPLSLPRPLGPLVDVAPALGPGFERLLHGDAPRATLLAALRDALQASTHLLVFEDVHWADDATLDVLRYLGRRLEATRSLVVATFRDDEVGPRHPLAVALGDVATAPAVRRLAVRPLSVEAVAVLARGSGRDPAELHRRTGGNPFFASELLASGGDTLPPTLRDAVLARAARLSPEARYALDAAAVLGPRMDAALLHEVARADEASIDECLDRGVLARDGAQLAFRHELARDAVLAALSPPRAIALHRAALAARRSRSFGPDELATLAHHAEAAGDAEAVLALAPPAARRAAALRSHREAAAQYARALRFASALPAAERAALFEGRSYECYLTSQIEEAASARRQALELWQQIGDRVKVGESHRWLSRLAWFLGRRDDVDAHAREALAVLEGAGDATQLAWACSNMSQAQMLAGRVREAVGWGERAIEIAERESLKDVLTHALNNVGTARVLAEPWGEGAALLGRSLALALELGAEEHVARAYTNLGSTRVMTRGLADARRQLEAGIAYSSDHDLDSWRLYMLGWLAVCAFWEGRWAEAAGIAEGMLAHPALAPPSRVQPLVVLGRVRTRRGDSGAQEALEAAQRVAEGTAELQRLAPVAAAVAEAAWLAGDLARARPAVEPAYRLSLEHDDPWTRGELAFWMRRAGAIQALPPGCAEPYVLQAGGRARDAASAWKALGCPYDAAAALVDEDSEDGLREAHDALLALGARPLADRAARRLRERGVRGLARRPRASTRAHPGGLTTREVEVLRLVAAGLRNAEIAERLSVSAKTVEHHVSAVLRKAGARSRSEAAGRAAAILGELGGAPPRK